MPLVAHNKLPTFQVLRDDGHVVLSLDRAKHQDIRELHIGFLNMMPDAALTATERQFIHLVGGSNPIAQFFVYPFSLPELNRNHKVIRPDHPILRDVNTRFDAPHSRHNDVSRKQFEDAGCFVLAESEDIAADYVSQLAATRNGTAPDFPEDELIPHCDNTWGDTGKAIVNNWLGLVYQLTNLDRRQQFMPGVDPDDPLQLRQASTRK